MTERVTGAKDAKAAYAHREAHPDQYAVPHPSAEVLANVALIRAHEEEETRKMEEHHADA
jgi:hypothetical protein